MAFKHGKDTVITLNAVDLSTFTTTSEFNRSADSHDVTAYGKFSHVFAGGLLNATASMSGTYDDGVTGPRATIEPLIGTVVTLIRKPVGTGAGRPQDSVSVLVIGYVETNPVAGMVAWSCEMQCSDEVTTTAQV